MVRRIALLAFGLAAGAAEDARAETALASFYGAESGRVTASGQVFRPLGLSVASRTLPFGTVLRIAFGGRAAVCVVNDRGPARKTGRALDLSRGCARAIGLERAGIGRVTYDIVRIPYDR